MLNSLAAKLHYKSLFVKDLIVKFCLHFFHKNASFVKNFLHCKILIKNHMIFCSFLLDQKWTEKIKPRLIGAPLQPV